MGNSPSDRAVKACAEKYQVSEGKEEIFSANIPVPLRASASEILVMVDGRTQELLTGAPISDNAKEQFCDSMLTHMENSIKNAIALEEKSRREDFQVSTSCQDDGRYIKFMCFFAVDISLPWAIIKAGRLDDDQVENEVIKYNAFFVLKILANVETKTTTTTPKAGQTTETTTPQDAATKKNARVQL